MTGFGVAPAKAPQPEPQIVPQTPESDPNFLIAKQDVQAGIRRGANWFYWIAGLSVVNSVMAMAGTNGRFIVGLGVTDLIGSISRDLGTTGAMAGLIVNAFAVGVFVMLGVFANKHQKWAFIAGMALYTADAALLVAAQQWLSIAFHAWVLYSLWNGFSRIAENEELTQRFQLHTI